MINSAVLVKLLPRRSMLVKLLLRRAMLIKLLPRHLPRDAGKITIRHAVLIKLQFQ